MATNRAIAPRKSGQASLVCPSTRAFWEESRRTADHSIFDFLHGYFYSRWPYLYIGIASGEHKLAKLYLRWGKIWSILFPSKSDPSSGKLRAADKYHAKVLTTSAARRMLMVKEDIRLENLETIIPYSQARDLILKHPDHIVVIDCPCRSSRPDPCSPLSVCLIVGEPFASFIVEHHPERARWIDQEQAGEILEKSHERGNVHHAFFNEPMLNRFFGICNCCSCCCVAMQAMRNGIPMIASSGYVSVLSRELCTSCEICAERCPFGAIQTSVGIVEVDRRICKGCGVCVSICIEGAISLIKDPTRSEPLEVEHLLQG